jgi:hypothetical protein
MPLLAELALSLGIFSPSSSFNGSRQWAGGQLAGFAASGFVQHHSLSSEVNRDQEFRQNSISYQAALTGKDFPSVKPGLTLKPMLGADLHLSPK